MKSERSPICLRLVRWRAPAASSASARRKREGRVVLVGRPLQKSGQQIDDVERRQFAGRDALMGERSLDQLLEVLRRRFTSNNSITHRRWPRRLQTPRAIASTVPMSFCEFRSQLYNTAHVICPLCGERRARRGCPALDKQICSVCCATKRLVEIQCPARLRLPRPPPASTRQPPPFGSSNATSDLLVQCMRDLSERQSQLFFLISTFLQRYEPPELQPLIDDDVAEAAAALAGTFETAVRGVIYEHRPAALPGRSPGDGAQAGARRSRQACRIGLRSRRGGRPAPRRGGGARAESRRSAPTAARTSTCSAVF